MEKAERDRRGRKVAYWITGIIVALILFSLSPWAQKQQKKDDQEYQCKQLATMAANGSNFARSQMDDHGCWVL